MDDALLTEFETFGVSINANILEKCVRLCQKYSVDPESFVVDWVAFSASKFNGEAPSSESLEVFERESLAKLETEEKIAEHPEDDLVVLNSQNIDQSFEDNDILAKYGTPSNKASVSKRVVSPTSTPTNKRLTSIGRTPSSKPSPGSFSPSTPSAGSQKFSSRTNAGDSVASFPAGFDISALWSQNAKAAGKAQVQLYEESTALKKDYKYMFERLRDRAAAVEERLLDIADHLAEKYNIEEWSSINALSTDLVRCVGRISCDASTGGKLNSASLLLESSSEFSSGQGVALNCSSIEEFSFFPGQTVAVEGSNPSGQTIIAEKILTPERLPLPETSLDVDFSNGCLKIAVASGPFTLLEDLDFSPLDELLNKINENPPHVLVLIGPFLETRNKAIETGLLLTTYEEEFMSLMEKIQTKLNSEIQVVIVSSSRDVHHYPTYPTPPYSAISQLSENFRFVADPSVLNISGTVIGVTSTDILLHLGKEEIAFNPHGSDRLGRLANHLLSQRSFYPLWPPPEELSVDAEEWEKYCKLPCTPHILVVPSDLRYFIKSVGDCVVVNPERATKGNSGGFYARLVVEASGSKVTAEDVKADIVRI